MLITQLVQAKYDSERVNVMVDKEFWASIDKSVLVKLGWSKGIEVTAGELQEAARQDASVYLSRKLIDYWHMRPRSELELRRKSGKLISKRPQELPEVDFEIVYEEARQSLADYGYTTAKFAKWFIDERVRQQKYGYYKIKSDLVKKGLSAREASKYMEQYYDKQIEAKTKSHVLSKKYGFSALSEIEDYKLRQKAYRFLKSRGF